MTGLEVVEIPIEEFDSAQFQSWLGETSPELFREYLLTSSEARSNLLSCRFKKLFANVNSEIHVCKRGNEYLAIIGFERLDWDSRHFGVECGRISPYCISRNMSRVEQSEIHKLMLDLGVEWARRHNVRVLQRRLLSRRLREINVLEELGFHMVDNVVTLAASIKDVLSATRKRKSDLIFRSPEKDELEPLISMTRGAFPYSRFLNDKVLTEKLGDDLYLKWIARLFSEVTESKTSGAVDLGIIVGMLQDQVVGYVTYRVDQASPQTFGSLIATIELIVVDSAFQGMGIGQNLFREASLVLSNLGADLLESSTWMNQRLAMSSNQKAGLCVRENLFTYHLCI